MHHFRFAQRTVAVAVAVLALAYTVEAFRIPDFAAVDIPVQSGTLPKGLGLLLLGLAVALFFQRPRGAAGATAGDGATADGATAFPATVAAVPPVAGAPVAAPTPTGATESAPDGTADRPADGAARPGGKAVASTATLGRFDDVRLDVAVLFGTMCLYVALFEPLGFLLSTGLYVVGMAWYLGFGRHWANVLVGGGVSTSLYLGMSEGLGIALPTGPLPF